MRNIVTIWKSGCNKNILFSILRQPEKKVFSNQTNKCECWHNLHHLAGVWNRSKQAFGGTDSLIHGEARRGRQGL
jgi:hypothetical protein